MKRIIFLILCVCAFAQVNIYTNTQTLKQSAATFATYIANKGDTATTLAINKDVYITGKLTLPKNIDVLSFGNRARFRGVTNNKTDTLVIARMSAQTNEYCFDTNLVVRFLPQSITECNPRWFTPAGTADDKRGYFFARKAFAFVTGTIDSLTYRKKIIAMDSSGGSILIGKSNTLDTPAILIKIGTTDTIKTRGKSVFYDTTTGSIYIAGGVTVAKKIASDSVSARINRIDTSIVIASKLTRTTADTVYSRVIKTPLILPDSISTPSIKSTRTRSDSAINTASKTTRSYYTSSRGDTSYSLIDTARTMRCDTIRINKKIILTGSLTNATKLSADTIAAVKLLQLTETSDNFGEGNIWHDASTETVECYTNGVTGYLNKTLFAQRDIVQDSNSVAEVSLRGVDSSTFFDSLPANWFNGGKRLRYGIGGIYSTKASAPGTLTLRLKLNAAVICSTVVTLDANETESYWRMDGAIVCRSAGVSGVVASSTSWIHSIYQSGHETIHGAKMITRGKTINTTIKQKPNLTAQYSTADVSNKILSLIFYLEEVH